GDRRRRHRRLEGELHRSDRSQWRREDDAPPRPGRDQAARPRDRGPRRVADRLRLRPGTVAPPSAPLRVRVPGGIPGARADGVGERRSPPAAARQSEVAGAAGGSALVRAVRYRRPGAPSTGRAVGRASSARRHRPGHRHRAFGRLRRRAHRRSRFGDDPSHHGSPRVGGASRQRRPRGRHPRPRGGGPLRRSDLDPRRALAAGGMKNILSLAGSLLRGGGRRTILDLSLTVVGVAIPVAVILLVVGTVTGFRERENAMAWREPTPATAEATALQRRTYQPWKGRRVDIVERRAIESTPPVPPGMDRFPREGEVWVSPALREALDEDGWFTFEQRVGGQIVGLLEDEALAHDDELVAVVGNGSLEPTPEDELLPYDHRHGGGFLPSDVLPVSEFAESGEDPGLPLLYMVSAWIAGALLVAPSISRLGAGARVRAARRGRRLVAPRRAGATSGQVTALAALETASGAVLGIGRGVAVALVGMAVVSSRIPLGGGRFSFSDLLPSPLAVSVILVGALLVAVASALAGLREVRTPPLGVVRQGRRKRPGWRRFLVMVVAWTAFIATIPFTQGTGEYVVLVAGLAVVILSISTVGPVFAWFMGWLTIRLTRGPRGLVAGRRLMADPIGSFRPTTGLVLISFVAGFLLLSSATLPEVSTNDSALVLATFGPGDRSDATEWRQKLADVYPQATFDESAHGDLAIMLPPGADVEAERARIAGITGTFPLTEAELDFENRLFTDDVRRAVWVVVAIALIQAAAATGVGSAASVLEQANTLAALSLTGTPTSQLQGARALQSAIPITVSSAVFVTLGAAAGGLTIVGIQPDVTIVVPSLVQA